MIEQYGDHLRLWVGQWDESMVGAERERAMCILVQFRPQTSYRHETT